MPWWCRPLVHILPCGCGLDWYASAYTIAWPPPAQEDLFEKCKGMLPNFSITVMLCPPRVSRRAHALPASSRPCKQAAAGLSGHVTWHAAQTYTLEDNLAGITLAAAGLRGRAKVILNRGASIPPAFHPPWCCLSASNCTCHVLCASGRLPTCSCISPVEDNQAFEEEAATLGALWDGLGLMQRASGCTAPEADAALAKHSGDHRAATLDLMGVLSEASDCTPSGVPTLLPPAEPGAWPLQLPHPPHNLHSTVPVCLPNDPLRSVHRRLMRSCGHCAGNAGSFHSKRLTDCAI